MCVGDPGGGRWLRGRVCQASDALASSCEWTSRALKRGWRLVTFSRRISCDHLVLELDEDEGSGGDGADSAGADHDVLEGALALGWQGEAAVAAAAQRVAGAGIEVELGADGLFHRDVHAV